MINVNKYKISNKRLDQKRYIQLNNCLFFCFIIVNQQHNCYDFFKILLFKLKNALSNLYLEKRIKYFLVGIYIQKEIFVKLLNINQKNLSSNEYFMI